MKNDLISRSALMNHLRVNVFVDVTPALEQAVKDEPTAYDVDKVVEQLKEEFKKYYGNQWDEAPYLANSIEIVKSGGVNKDEKEN